MIDKLEMFVELARARHFGRASLAVGVTQPTLSSAIMQLEDTLGVPLVLRGSRFQGLTPEGEAVLIRARAILAEVRALKDEARSSRQNLSGRIRLGVIPTALPMVAELVAPLTARHPGITVTILSRSAAEIAAGIDRFDLDAGITYAETVPPRHTAVPLYDERLSLLMSAGHPLAQTGRAGWSDIADFPLCLLSGEMQNRRIVEERLLAAGVRAQPQVDSNSILAIIGHVRTGKWLSVVPERLVRTLLDDTLRMRPLPGPGTPVILVAAAREPRAAPVQALLAEARRSTLARAG